MKKLLFALVALLMAGNAMADRVVTFDMETDHAVFVDFVYNSTGQRFGHFQLSKDGVVIDMLEYYDQADEMYPWAYGNSYVASPTDDDDMDEYNDEFEIPSLTVTSELYSVDDEAPAYEAYYGGIRKIEIETFATNQYEMPFANLLYVIRPSGYDDSYTCSDDDLIGTYECFSNYGHCPEFVDFAANSHVRMSKITVTLYGVDPVTPPAPTERTAAPVFNGYTIDGIHAYFIEIVETEPSTIYYKVYMWDDELGDWAIYGEDEWTEYEWILSFTDEGKYRVVAYAVAPGKADSYDIAYEFVVSPITGLSELANGKTISNVRYFNMAGQEMSEANGLTIVVTTYTDGTTSTAKVVK